MVALSSKETWAQRNQVTFLMPHNLKVVELGFPSGSLTPTADAEEMGVRKLELWVPWSSDSSGCRSCAWTLTSDHAVSACGSGSCTLVVGLHVPELTGVCASLLPCRWPGGCSGGIAGFQHWGCSLSSSASSSRLTGVLSHSMSRIPGWM